MAISLNLRQEILAADSAYVAVNEVLSVSGISGSAATDISRPFVLLHQNSESEVYKQIVDASKMDSIPYSPLKKIKLIPNTYSIPLVSQTAAVTIDVPDYWETKHFSQLDATGSTGEVTTYSTLYKFVDTTYNAFSQNDVGKKINILNGSNIGVYPVVNYLGTDTLVIDGVGSTLTAETGISWELLSYSYTNISIISVSGDEILLSQALPSQTPDPENQYLNVHLLDSSGSPIQQNVKAIARREDTSLSELRDSVFYSFHGTSKAAEAHNNSVLTNLQTLIDDINVVGSAAGSHTVTTVTI